MGLRYTFAVTCAVGILLSNVSTPAATAQVDGACTLTPSIIWDLNEGPTPPDRFPDAVGTLRAKMLFVDFSDAPAGGQDTAPYSELLIPDSRTWFEEVSYGRASLEVDVVDRWFRMPKPSTDYSFKRGLTFANHQRYIQDALSTADPHVDFRQTDLFFIVVPRSALEISFSPAFVGGAWERPIQTEEGAIGFGATFGQDIHNESWGWRVLVHETGHTLSLPDLYSYQPADPDYWTGVQGFVGAWDPMGYLGLGTHLFAWHKAKLGWLEPSQVKCITTNAPISQVLAPLAADGGVKALVIKTGPDSAIVAENRQAIGHDSRICSEGLLVYSVHASIANGMGPIRVLPSGPSNSASNDRCGTFHDAVFTVDGAPLFHDEALGVSIEVQKQEGDLLTVSAQYSKGPAGPDTDPTNQDPPGETEDLAPPVLNDLSIKPKRITPDGDGKKDSAEIRFSLGEEADVTIVIEDSSGTLTGTLFEGKMPPGPKALRWDGKADGGGKAAAGRYRITVSASDQAGNTAKISGFVTVKRK